jgi:hypothetical protein
MASIITAGNATNGLALSCDNTGILELKTGTGAGTTAVTIGTGQQVAVTLGSAAAPSITFSGDTNTGIFSPAADTIAFTEGGVESARFDSSGNLLVGTTSDVLGSALNSIQAKSSGACHGFYRVSSSAASGIGFFYSDSGSTQRTQAYFRVDGGLANYSANNQNLSDERIKKDISLSGSYLSKICAIPVKNFRYKKDDDTSPITLGVIAQDVQAIAPELVCTDGFENEKADDGSELLSIYQTDLQYALMKCIQEQQQMIETLQAEVAALKGA